MSNAVSMARPGRTFVRGVIATALARGNAEGFAANRWGTTQAGRIAKAALPPMLQSGDGSPDAREFFAMATEQSLLGRLSNLRRIAFNVGTIRQSKRAAGHWVAEGSPIRVSSQDLQTYSLPPLKVASIVISTEEALQAWGEVSEAALQRDLLDTIALGIDRAFADPANAGEPGESPASVSSGGIQIASSGDVATDINALFDAYEGDFRAASIAMHPKTAVQIGLAPAGLGETKLTVQGGVLAGVPVVASEGVPFGTIVLLDAGAIAYGARDFQMTTSNEAVLEVDDDSDETQHVSLWQNNLVAWRAVGTANWSVHGTGRVVTITGADYAQEA